MTLLEAHQGRKWTKDLSILDANGDTITPGADDVVRVKIGRRAGNSLTPLLDLDSVAASTNGSIVNKNSPSNGTHRTEISVADMATLNPGTYTLELAFVDSTDGDAVKHVDHQVFHVGRTMGGDVGDS